MLGPGLLYAVVSAVCNGTYGVLAKLRPVANAAIPTFYFNLWVGSGVVLSSLPILALHPAFTPWGMLSGLLFILSTACGFFAIQQLGLSIASGIWCGTAVVFSFTFGVKFAGETLSRPALAVVALLFLAAGIAGIALNGHAARRLTRQNQFQDAEDGGQPLLETVMDTFSSSKEGLLQQTEYLWCIAAAVATGAFGGLILAPMSFAPKECQGVQFVPSMAAGVLLAAPIITALLFWVSKADWPDLQQTKVAAVYGEISGLIWNLGNIASIKAVQDPHVGLAVAYPIMQCGLFVAGIWGSLLFRELQGRALLMHFVCGVVLIVGAAFLAASK